MAVLPVNYTNVSPPTGALSELPATTSRGLNAINAQINTNTTAINSVAPYPVDAYGADPTGVAFSDTAVAAAITAMGFNPGVLVFGVGTYKLNTTKTLASPGQGIDGQGSGATIIDWRGTGDCLRVWDPSGDSSHRGGRITGLQITAASNANTNINGIHIGDLQGIFIEDVFVQGFSTSGSIGFWGENRLVWSERAHLNLDVRNCTNCYVFEKYASHPMSNTSWDYGWFDLSFVAQTSQNGVTLKNNVDMVGVDLSVVGNTVQGAGNTGVVLTVGTTSSDTSIITGRLSVNVESEGTGTGHTDFTVGAAARIDAEGFRKFSGTFVAGVVGKNVLWPSLGSAWQTKVTAGANLVYDPRLTDSGFTRDAAWDNAAGSIAYSIEQFHSSTQSIKFITSTATSANNDRFAVSTHNYGGDLSGDRAAQPLKVQGGQEFYYEVYARQKSTNTNVAGNLLLTFITTDTTGANGVTFPSVSVAQSTISNSAWTKVSGVVTIPAGFDMACPAVWLQGHTVASQAWYFDDFRIIDVSYPLASWTAVPSTATSTGNVGQMAADSSFLYVCTATNVWDRGALTGWVNTVASSATPAINTDTTSVFTITALAAAITSMTTNLTGTPVEGQSLAIRFKDNGTARAITWGAKFVAGPAALLTTTVISKTHYTEFRYDAVAAVWACVISHTAGY